jgi:hypothetical protein
MLTLEAPLMAVNERLLTDSSTISGWFLITQ